MVSPTPGRSGYILPLVLIAVLILAPSVGLQAQCNCPIGGFTDTACPIRTDAVIANVVAGRLAGLVTPVPGGVVVNVLDGVVILRGYVNRPDKVVLASVLASSVRGVRFVYNQISVIPGATDDVAIVGKIRNAMSRTTYNFQQARVTSNEGVVTLSGIVDTELASSQAEIIAMATPGVVTVRNNLFIDQPGDPW